MREHEKETIFLRQCIRYDESVAGRQLDEKITRVQRDEHCLRRASWLMALVAALATAGLGYGTVLVDDFPHRMSAFFTQFVIQVTCALGVGSLICLVAFAAFHFVYRRELNARREECRRLVTNLLESRLGKPVTTPWREGHAGNGNSAANPVALGRNGSPSSPNQTFGAEPAGGALHHPQ